MSRRTLTQQMSFDGTVPIENDKIRAELEQAVKDYDANKEAAARYAKADRVLAKHLSNLKADGPTCFALSESGPFIYVYVDTVDRSGSPSRKAVPRLRKQVSMVRQPSLQAKPEAQP